MSIFRLYSPDYELQFDAHSSTQPDVVIPTFFSVSAECTKLEPNTLSDVTPHHWVGGMAMKGYLLEMGESEDSGVLHILSERDYATFGATSSGEAKEYGAVARILIPEDQTSLLIGRLARHDLVEVGAALISASRDEVHLMRSIFDPKFRGRQ